MCTGIWEHLASSSSDGPAPRQGYYSPSPRERLSDPRYPVTLGYNNVGDVIAVGANVFGISIGDRVFSLSRHQDFFDVPSWQVVRIPKDLPDVSASFAYLATLGLHALRRSRFNPGENVAIVGLGLVGSATALMARAIGARTFAFDINTHRRAVLGAVFGNDYVFDPREPGSLDRLQENVAPHGVDVVIEAGGTRGSLDLALRLADTKARVAVIALHPEEVGNILAGEFFMRELAILSASNDSFEDRSVSKSRFTVFDNISFALELADHGALPLDLLHTMTVPADNLQTIMEILDDKPQKYLGVTLSWGEDDDREIIPTHD